MPIHIIINYIITGIPKANSAAVYRETLQTTNYAQCEKTATTDIDVSYTCSKFKMEKSL